MTAVAAEEGMQDDIQATLLALMARLASPFGRLAGSTMYGHILAFDGGWSALQFSGTQRPAPPNGFGAAGQLTAR